MSERFVANLIKHRLQELDFVPEDAPMKKVTSRLPVPIVDNLDRVASQLHMTRTNLAEQLLTEAVADAISYFNEHPEIRRKGLDLDVIDAIEDGRIVAGQVYRAKES